MEEEGMPCGTDRVAYGNYLEKDARSITEQTILNHYEAVFRDRQEQWTYRADRNENGYLGVWVPADAAGGNA